jgi:hypothetical protein
VVDAVAADMAVPPTVAPTMGKVALLKTALRKAAPLRAVLLKVGNGTTATDRVRKELAGVPLAVKPRGKRPPDGPTTTMTSPRVSISIRTTTPAATNVRGAAEHPVRGAIAQPTIATTTIATTTIAGSAKDKPRRRVRSTTWTLEIWVLEETRRKLKGAKLPRRRVRMGTGGTGRRGTAAVTRRAINKTMGSADVGVAVVHAVVAEKVRIR